MSDYEYDSGNESSNEEDDLEDDDGVLLALEPENNSIIQDGLDLDDDYPYKVLSTDDIMMHMIDTIREVNTVVQVCLWSFIVVFNRIFLLASTNYHSNFIKSL